MEEERQSAAAVSEKAAGKSESVEFAASNQQQRPQREAKTGRRGKPPAMHCSNSQNATNAKNALGTFLSLNFKLQVLSPPSSSRANKHIPLFPIFRRPLCLIACLFGSIVFVVFGVLFRSFVCNDAPPPSPPLPSFCCSGFLGGWSVANERLGGHHSPTLQMLCFCCS